MAVFPVLTFPEYVFPLVFLYHASSFLVELLSYSFLAIDSLLSMEHTSHQVSTVAP